MALNLLGFCLMFFHVFHVFKNFIIFYRFMLSHLLPMRSIDQIHSMKVTINIVKISYYVLILLQHFFFA